MKQVLDPERRAAIAERLRFYRDLGVYDFYRRAVPRDAGEAGLAGDAISEAAGVFESGSTAECEPMKTGRRSRQACGADRRFAKTWAIASVARCTSSGASKSSSESAMPRPS